MSEWDFLEEDNHFDLEEFLKNRAEEQKAEYENLSYFEREERRAKLRDARQKSKEDFEKIRVSPASGDMWVKISEYIEGINDLSPHEIVDYLKKADEAFNNDDINALDNIYDEIQKPLSERNLLWYKKRIHESIGCNITEIENILNSIKYDFEAGIVLASINGSDWITKLPKQYPVEPIYSQYTYKDQVRLHRRMLEKDLQEVGVLARRAQKISQILLSI